MIEHSGVLDVDERQPTKVDIQLPVGLSGDYWILVESDEDNRVFEYIFESNNIRQSNSQISIDLTPYADLAASDVSAPDETLAGEPITITWSVSNEGEGTTGDGTPDGTIDQWTDRIVFSRNAVYGDGDDRIVAEVPHDGAIAPGGAYATPGTWTGELPGVFSGEYYVFVATDAGEDIYEHDDSHANVARSDG